MASIRLQNIELFACAAPGTYQMSTKGGLDWAKNTNVKRNDRFTSYGIPKHKTCLGEPFLKSVLIHIIYP
ncbi:Uncharacterized protein HZ326_27682 [Fusarium oxysporum f. sp. albedinis]|nr:Uncharacterized protein HZ326_27682 [Fusarium oxysporum f. sp. albedinis]